MPVKKKDIKRLISKLNKIENVSEETILFLKNNYLKMFDKSECSNYNVGDGLPIKGKTFPNSKIVKSFISSHSDNNYAFIFNRLLDKDWINIITLLKDGNRLKATIFLKNTFKADISLKDAKFFIDDFYQYFLKK